MDSIHITIVTGKGTALYRSIAAAGSAGSPPVAADSVTLQQSADSPEPDMKAIAARMLLEARSHVDWQRGTEWPNNHENMVSPDGNRVYYADIGPSLYCTDLQGNEKWKISMGREVLTTPYMMPDGSIAVLADQKVKTLGVDGKLLWESDFTTQNPELVLVGPDGMLYVTTRIKEGKWPRYIQALDPKDGSSRWKQDLEEWIPQEPVQDREGNLFYVDGNRNFCRIDKEGNRQLSVKTEGLGFHALMAGSDGTIYMTDSTEDLKKSMLRALNPDGTEKWRYETGKNQLKMPPLEGPDGTIYLLTWSKPTLIALSKEGQKVWEQPLGDSSSEQQHAVGPDGTIYVPQENMLHAFNPDGTILFREDIGEYIQHRPVFTADGHIHFNTRNYHFSLKNNGQMIRDDIQNLGSETQQECIINDDDMLIIGGLRIEKNNEGACRYAALIASSSIPLILACAGK